MKQFKIALLTVATVITMQTTKAQTADEIVTKHITAMGGKEKLATLKTARMEAVMNTQGTDVDLIITKSQMVGQRIDIAVMGMNGYQIYTPTGGWSFMPFMGQTSPEVMKEEQAKAGAGGLDLQGNLFNYKEKETQIELLSKEKLDSSECYKIKATLKSGKIITYFIDTKTNYIVQSVSKQSINGEEKEVTNGYANYKTTGDGFVFPYTGITSQGTMNFSKIEVNIPIDEKIFTAN